MELRFEERARSLFGDASDEPPEERRRGFGWRVIAALSMVVIVVCVVSICWFYSFLQDKLFAERQAFFTQFAQKTAENIDLAIDNLWRLNQLSQEYLLLSPPQNEEELIARLAYCSDGIASGQAAVIAFTEDGGFVSSDGHAGWFGGENAVSFADGASARQTAIVNLPYEGTDRTYFLLFSRMEEPLAMGDGRAVSHLALAVDVVFLQEMFAAHGFGDSCHTYFVTDTGRKLYQSTDSQRFIEGYNILATLESSAEVIGGGTMGDLLSAFGREGSSAFEISYQDEKWFVSFQTVASGSHHLVVFAPTSLIGNNAAELSRVSFWFLLLICLLLGLLFAAVVLSVRAVLRKLHQVNGLLEREAKLADRANHAKSEFLSYMSHDIRTPINGIIGMTGIAMRNEHDHAKVMDCLGKIEEAAGHLLSLVNDVLDLSRIEQGKTAIVCETVRLPVLLEECASIIEGQLSTRDLVFERDFGNLVHPWVLTDELHLRQILINILGNAVKFTPDGGRVSFRVRQVPADGDGRVGLVFEVEDTGIGMSEAYLQHIWEPFSQSRQGQHAAYEGTGLGMAITKRFVDMMEGSIDVKSQLGAGSTFIVRLTVAIDERGLADERGRLDARAFAAENDLTGLRVLLVEDKELNREIAQEALQSAGAEVVCAENGLRALELFEGSPAGTFDVVLMDVMMPVMGGLEATRRIRASQHPEAQSVPIIALTANAFEEDVRRSLEAGMDQHLSKPINARDLTRVLARYRGWREGAGCGGAGCGGGACGPEACEPEAPVCEGGACEGAASEAAFPSETLAGKCILVAEDDMINREVSCALLEERGAYVVAVEDGRQAVEAFADAAEGFFDAVLMDVHMPVMGGVEAIGLIRAMDRGDSRCVPVFVLTADCSPREEAALTDAGASGFLLKPLDVARLAALIA